MLTYYRYFDEWYLSDFNNYHVINRPVFKTIRKLPKQVSLKIPYDSRKQDSLQVTIVRTLLPFHVKSKLFNKAFIYSVLRNHKEAVEQYFSWL